MYINYQYIKTATKMTIRRMIFSNTTENWIYCWREEMGCLFVKTGHLCIYYKHFSSFFYYLLKYRWNNEIRTRRVTIKLMVIINALMEKKDEMIRKISAEIKRLIKEHVLLSLTIWVFSRTEENLNITVLKCAYCWVETSFLKAMDAQENRSHVLP